MLQVIATNNNQLDGIHARRFEVDNIVSSTQIQEGFTQTATALVQLTQAIQQGDISADEIKARHLVSGLQYIADPTQASVDDLRHELAALRTKLEHAIAAHEILDAADAEDAQASLTTAEADHHTQRRCTSVGRQTWRSGHLTGSPCCNSLAGSTKALRRLA